MNDEQLRNLHERLTYLRNLEEKKEQVIASIEEQGKLTEELKERILAAETQVVVEDLYRPYRPKRKTRASVAREKGLEGLADTIRAQEITSSLEEEAKKYLSEEKEVASVEEALQGAKDIIAESISDEADSRLFIRKITVEEGIITSEAKDEKAQSVYEMYYHYEEPVKKVAGHRVLAFKAQTVFRQEFIGTDGGTQVVGSHPRIGVGMVQGSDDRLDRRIHHIAVCFFIRIGLRKKQIIF